MGTKKKEIEWEMESSPVPEVGGVTPLRHHLGLERGGAKRLGRK